MVGTRGPYPGAFGRGICPGEPHCSGGNLSGLVLGVPGPTARILFPLVSRHSAEPVALAPRQSAGGAPYAGTVQRDLLRALLPGPLSRFHAGSGGRPDGARQPRIPPNTRRPQAGGCDLAARGRRLQAVECLEEYATASSRWM